MVRERMWYPVRHQCRLSVDAQSTVGRPCEQGSSTDKWLSREAVAQG